MLIKRLMHRWVLMEGEGDGGGSGGGVSAPAAAPAGGSAGGEPVAAGTANGDAGNSAPVQPTTAAAPTGEAASPTDTGLNPPPSLIGEQAPVEGEAPKEGEQPTEAPVEEKPIEYADFTLPEGAEVNAEQMAAFKEAAAGAKLTQEQAQSFVDLHQQALQKASEGPYELWRDTQKAWQDEIKADPEFGGAHLEKETLPAIAKAITAFTPDAESAKALRQAFSFTGAGNNPEMIRFMARVGKAMSEGTFVTGKPTSGDGGKSAAQTLYPTHGAGNGGQS